jgi:hypothetical protein
MNPAFFTTLSRSRTQLLKRAALNHLPLHEVTSRIRKPHPRKVRILIAGKSNPGQCGLRNQLVLVCLKRRVQSTEHHPMNRSTLDYPSEWLKVEFLSCSRESCEDRTRILTPFDCSTEHPKPPSGMPSRFNDASIDLRLRRTEHRIGLTGELDTLGNIDVTRCVRPTSLTTFLPAPTLEISGRPGRIRLVQSVQPIGEVAW